MSAPNLQYPPASGGGTPVGGSGTPGTIPVWSGTGTTLTDSPLTVSGSNVTGAGAIRATGTTAGAPAFTGSDTDTGIYFPAANQVRFSTAGSPAMAIDASQQVGIGTTSPGAKLDVSDGANGRFRFAGPLGTAAYADVDNFIFRSSNAGLTFGTFNGSRLDISTTAGYGLKLPATPGATGAGSEQTLDCYQENTWTPSVAGFGGTAPTVTTAKYTRVGRIVFCNVIIDPTGGAAFDSTYGTATISAPFSASTNCPVTVNRGGQSSIGAQGGTTVFIPTFSSSPNTMNVSWFFVV
jgi:hypothetical protein